MKKKVAIFFSVLFLAVSTLMSGNMHYAKASTLVIDLNTIKPDPTAGYVLAYVVNANTLNVRRGPSTGYEVIGSVSLNEVVKIIGTKSSAPGWSYIEYGTANGDKVGWVYDSYLQHMPS